MVKLTVHGSVREYPGNTLLSQVADDEGRGNAVAARVNGTLCDLSCQVTAGSSVEFIGFESPEGREVFRHSAAHVMAQAAKRVIPDLQLTIGPPVEDGFYYDFETSEPLTPEIMRKIEKEMKKVVHEKHPFERIELLADEAKKKQKGQRYKIEMIDDLGDDTVTIYRSGEFLDLCKGPHVPHTGCIKAFKLTKLAGAYWRGNQNNKQLQRVYGVAFPTKEELDSYLKMLAEAEKRDHRKLGRELGFFSLHEEGPGFVFWHPLGLFLFNRLLQLWRSEHAKAGYVEVKTPVILSRHLWEKSGHWKNYRENMYFTKIDNEDYAIKPMNCPGGMLMYKEKVHSYRELPMRVGEIGLVHRHELSGVLSGLFRVRMFHQDDAHIYMTPKQIKAEIIGVIELTDRLYSMFGLSYHMELSTRPKKSIGTDEQWKTATQGLKDALESTGREYKVNEGDGAFYGPKIDFHIKDAIGRTWQCGTIQLDMAQPDNFDLTYMGEDGKDCHRPVMIHRTIYGSLERFIGILIEHYEGKFPLWLSPVQVKIAAVADRFTPYAQKVHTTLKEAGFRPELDSRAESVSKKIRDATLERVNYILVVGEKEETEGTVNVRARDGTQKSMKLADFVSQLECEQ